MSSNDIKEGIDKAAPYSSNSKSGHLTNEQLENILISMFRVHNTETAYWYNISRDGDDSICRLLGCDYVFFENLMLSMKLFVYYGKNIRCKKERILSWCINNEIIVKINEYKPHRGGKQYYLRLGIT